MVQAQQPAMMQAQLPAMVQAQQPAIAPLAMEMPCSGGGLGGSFSGHFQGQFQGQFFAENYAKGKGKGKGKMLMLAQDYGIPGFDDALTEALLPYVHQHLNCDLEEIKSKVAQKIVKAAQKLATDERLSQRGTATQAKGFIEEFVDSAMHALSAGLYDRPWFDKVNFAGPFLAVTLFSFAGTKIFARTLAPMVERVVESSLFNWREEERIQKAMWDAIATCGVKESHRKKASTHLARSYDEAHLRAPYGSSTADTPEMGLLQDFIRGWMADFVGRSWDLLENGISGGNITVQEQVAFVTVLFQSLTDAGNACLPHELTAQISAPPPSPWPFIAQCAEGVFAAALSAEPRAPKRRRAGFPGG
mmetsp:Transcript_17254/g.49279  ORF Transcript_17254/g.49279 Transcript_17254/m.49279 type:complete len:361 (-) Transcript_17254:84-1166(-)